MCGRSSQGGLSTEAVAGVAIAAVTVALLLVALACWACFKKRRERQIRAQRDSDSRRVYKEQHVELQQSTDSCNQPAQPAKVDKTAIAAVSSLQALSQQDTSQHSGPGQAAAATAGPPATNGGQPLPSVEAEPDSLVSNWLNKLTQTKIMNWLYQEQTPSNLKNSDPSMQSLHAGPTLQRSSVGQSSVARSSFTLNRTSVQHAWLNRIHSSPSIHDMSSAQDPTLCPYGEQPTGGSVSGTSRATSAHAQPLPPMYSAPLPTGYSVSTGHLAQELIPPHLRHSPSGDSISSATFALPSMSPAHAAMPPTGGHSRSHSRTLSYTHSTGQLSALRFALPEESPRFGGMHPCASNEDVSTPTAAVGRAHHAAKSSDNVCVEITMPEARRHDADEC